MGLCGQCGFQGGGDEYKAHTCITGFNPTQIEHQDALSGGRFSRQAAKALERGAGVEGDQASKAVTAKKSPIKKRKTK